MSVWWKKMGVRDQRRFLREVRFGRENLWNVWKKLAGLVLYMACLLEFALGFMKKVPVGSRLDGVMALRESRSCIMDQRAEEKEEEWGGGGGVPVHGQVVSICASTCSLVSWCEPRWSRGCHVRVFGLGGERSHESRERHFWVRKREGEEYGCGGVDRRIVVLEGE
jgi:hypothetical protein